MGPRPLAIVVTIIGVIVVAMLVVVVVDMMSIWGVSPPSQAVGLRVRVIRNRDCSGPSCDFLNAILQIRITADTRARARAWGGELKKTGFRVIWEV